MTSDDNAKATTPTERTRAVIDTRDLLSKLASSRGVSGAVSKEARRLLRHYPEAGQIDLAAMAWPHVFSPWVNAYDGSLSYLQLLEAMAPFAYLSTSEIVDAQRIVRVCADHGVETTLQRAGAAWHAYSGGFAAKWMTLTADDDALFETVKGWLEIYGRE